MVCAPTSNVLTAPNATMQPPFPPFPNNEQEETSSRYESSAIVGLAHRPVRNIAHSQGTGGGLDHAIVYDSQSIVNMSRVIVSVPYLGNMREPTIPSLILR